jgi:hypothetical protein
VLSVGEKDLLVLTFDHINPADKKHEISSLLSGFYRLETLIEEVNKCRVLCCNCHARHSATQQMSWRLMVKILLEERSVSDEIV